MSLFGDSSHIHSGPLVAVVLVSFLECDSGDVELVKVEGEPDDVRWFEESWSMVGADMFWDREDCPKQPGKYLVAGRLVSWRTDTPDGVDYSEEFEIQGDVGYMGSE